MSTPAKSTPAKRRRTSARATSTAERRNHNGAAPVRELDDPSLYINRELSLLDFQRRVLEEAQDASNPLLDRLMFLSFVGSNIDEFFMVRVAGLKRQIEKGVVETGPDGMTPTEQLRAIRASVIRLYRGFLRHLAARIGAGAGARRESASDYSELSEEQLATVKRLLPGHRSFPTLTPLAFDPGRPFPHISNLSLNLAVVLRDQKGDRALCAREDSRHAAGPGAAGAESRRRRSKTRARARSRASSGLSSWSSRTWQRCSRAWKFSRRIRSTSRATRTSPSRTWKPAICSRSWRKAFGSGASPMWCAWKSPRTCLRRC